MKPCSGPTRVKRTVGGEPCSRLRGRDHALAVVWFPQVSIVGVTGPEARWAGYLLNLAGVYVITHWLYRDVGCAI
ncbi:hypothetical protein [Halolamina salina]|uniref:Uncharacterized protein n=1 Tax=Halolamina salina TaxID=1220023 RepID=A0ABD6B5B4_9EURY